MRNPINPFHDSNRDWAEAKALTPPAVPKCPYCNEPILAGQPTVIESGDRMHIGCSASLADGDDIDNDCWD